MRKLLYSISAITIIFMSACSINKKSVSLKQHSMAALSNVNISPYKSQMLYYINQLRGGKAKCSPPAPPLIWNESLEKAATAHSRDMAINHMLSHSGSGTSYDVAKPMPGTSSSFIDRINYFGYKTKEYMLVGENITTVPISKTKTPDLMANFKHAVDNIVNDKTHCEILMNPRFQYIGMGMYKTNDKYYFTMDLAEAEKNK